MAPAESLLAVRSGGEIFCEYLARGIRPAPRTMVSEWADANRILSSKGAAEPGPYRTSRTPYLREVMDCFSPRSPVERVVFMKGAQVGATEAGNNVIGYCIDKVPCPIMYVAPSLDVAKRYSQQKLDPLIEDCEVLRDKVSDPRSRDSGNSRLIKEFPGGILVMTGANSSSGLRQTSARVLILDDVDGFEGEIESAGDPVSLARRATRAFSSPKELMISTPTVKGRSRIETAYQASDQRHYYVPCPLCGKEQILRWRGIRYDRDKRGKVVRGTVRYRCEDCQQLFDEGNKPAMLAAGRWVPEVPELSDTVRGYHLPALYSPLGWRSWSDIAEAFVEAGGE